ncbi:response regulator [Methanobacterium sp.]|jgi:chemotaxis family two-component system response regulator Rcp1|uniref:response regulator n=1 Tax=Methanobacterium sp. TaxID=2164 RepID=UPI003158B1C1
MMGSNKITILVINNNPDEIKLMTNIIDIQQWNVNFINLKDGLEALNYLHKKGKYKNCKIPSLILLDFDLPKKSGLEVLKEIKTNASLKCIPVIILTNSLDHNEIIEAYEYHVNAYIPKPVDYDKFKEDIYIFKEFWFNNAKLPKIK